MLHLLIVGNRFQTLGKLEYEGLESRFFNGDWIDEDTRMQMFGLVNGVKMRGALEQ